MKTKFFIVAGLVLLIAIVGLRWFRPSDQAEQQVLGSTYNVSKEYLALRYRTDNVLIKAKDYADFTAWNEAMTALIQDWQTLARAGQLEADAGKQAVEAAINFELVQSAQAYTAKEITDIYDKAPRFKGISTLAKHLGVDAKKAQLILNQAQDETTAEGWTEAGDTFQKLETSAVVIKDGCKVAGFVGGMVITGGTAGFAAAGTMTQVGVVIVGADLALEVTEDGAQIALGDKNKISTVIKDVRTVTEPIASIINITNVPGSLGSTYGRFESMMLGLEQFRDTVQEGKVIGIDLRNFEYHPPFQVIKKAKYPGTVSVAEMDKAEVVEWLQSLNKKVEPMTTEEMGEFLNSPTKETVTESKSQEETAGTMEADIKKESTHSGANIPNQIITVVNVSQTPYMMDTCFSASCWDDLAANPAEDIDVGGIYTMGKVFANGQSFKTGFRPAESKASGTLVEKSANSYKITLYFALAPHEGPKNRTIEYGTWQSESIEISANYGDEPVIEWDGSSLKQVK